jgi:hypothetical protein
VDKRLEVGPLGGQEVQRASRDDNNTLRKVHAVQSGRADKQHDLSNFVGFWTFGALPD